MTVIGVREAYRRWAPSYCENALTFLEGEITAELSPPITARRLLDAGCGTGARIPHGAALSAGVDLSPEMLAVGGVTSVAAADVRQLPFAQSSFDLIWCRLVLSYLRDPQPAYREFARVCQPHGYLLVSDFHPEAAAAGLRRDFRDLDGDKYEIENYVHDAGKHQATASAAGFVLIAKREGLIGPSIKHFFLQTGREAAYDKNRNLPLIAAFLFQRT